MIDIQKAIDFNIHNLMSLERNTRSWTYHPNLCHKPIHHLQKFPPALLSFSLVVMGACISNMFPGDTLADTYPRQPPHFKDPWLRTSLMSVLSGPSWALQESLGGGGGADISR